jgi:hypothetical protein
MRSRDRASPKGLSAPAGDPVEQLLHQAAARAEDPAVKRWLTALLHHGESAEGRAEGPGARPGRPRPSG